MAKVSILIVEDDQDILKLLAYNFRTGGFEVATCETGHEAINRVRQPLFSLIWTTLSLILYKPRLIHVGLLCNTWAGIRVKTFSRIFYLLIMDLNLMRIFASL